VPATPEPPPVVMETPAPEVVVPEVQESRPRLSKTITLGQGTEWQYTPSAAVPAQGTVAPSSNVVVNNNIVVQGGAPGYYGYGYGGGRGYGRATTFTNNADGRFGARGTTGAPSWGASGWEGARRTAAPGQTPGVGGNWSAPPSYGPAQMK
jgi:hypothetical protein